MGVRLVCQQPHRATVAIRIDLEQRRQLGVIADLPGGQQQGERSAGAVDEGVDLCGPTAPGRDRWARPQTCNSTQPPVDLAAGAPAACWWARTLVESIETRAAKVSSFSSRTACTAWNIAS